jgi:anti-sigma factor RsiW
VSAPAAPAMDESLLSAYVDDELDAATRASVDARLADSAGWRSLLAEVREARDLVRALPVADAPAGFWERVLSGERTVAVDPVVNLATERARRRGRTTRWAGLASATAAAAILAVALVPRGNAVHPPLGSLTQAHAERASLSNDLVSNLAGMVVPESLRR